MRPLGWPDKPDGLVSIIIYEMIRAPGELLIILGLEHNLRIQSSGFTPNQEKACQCGPAAVVPGRQILCRKTM
jgi:hypothetical protein